MTPGLPLDSDCAMVVIPAPAPPAEVKRRIDALWDEQKKLRGDTLFDGRIYSLAEYRRDRLTIYPMSYRYFMAARKEPALAASINLRPLGVTGILTCVDGVLLGRRSSKVALFADRWECGPAGTMDREDPVEVLQHEIEEELGLSRDQVTTPVPFGLIEDTELGIFDVLLRVSCTLDAAGIKATQRAINNDEYSEIALVKPEAMAGFLAVHAGQGIPMLEPILRFAGLLI